MDDKNNFILKQQIVKHRYQGKKVALGLTLMIGFVVSVALFFWWRGREIQGPILAVTPVDSYRVLQIRRGFKQQKYIHLVMRDSRKGQIWSVALFGVQPGARPLVKDDRVALRVLNAQGLPEMHAFNLRTGRFAWRAGVAYLPRGERLVSSDKIVGDQIILSYAGSINRVLTINMDNGRVLREQNGTSH